MWFVLTFMSPLSLTAANFLRHDMLGWNPSYNSSTYYWGCGTNTTAARSDCEHALNRSCKVTVGTKENYDSRTGDSDHYVIWECNEPGSLHTITPGMHMLQKRRGSSMTAFEITDAWMLGHEGICFGAILAVHRLIVHLGYTDG
ncbi:hypothetical protein LB506_004048 [Fusarium annulatum]|nr:hypothetical protein LB506_004048 [Fusarium annulatum]